MNSSRLNEILAAIPKARIAVLGDFCLDAYWLMDRATSEKSVETGKSTVPIRQQRYSLGGAGNIVANLTDLGVGQIHAIGVIGDDLFGKELLKLLTTLKADTTGMIAQSDSWSTPVYGKIYSGDEEEPRIDFGNYNTLSDASANAVIDHLEKRLPSLDGVIINQQLSAPVVTDAIIPRLNTLIQRFPRCKFIVDSRDRSEHFKGVSYRFNAHEAARLCGKPHPIDQGITLDDATAFARRLFETTRQPVFISRGARGSIVAAADGVHIVPGIQVMKKTDPVGAGDTSVSAIASALATGATAHEAAILANYASTVTVQKIQTTGTATPAEIRTVGEDPQYVFRPELASDPRAAHYIEATEIELVTQNWPRCRFKHALFDHDGTISTLRQGWEPIMEDIFIRSIMGDSYKTADETLYNRVAARARDYIAKSTGIQTLTQMFGLVDMVREFGLVPADQILTPLGYKQVYLEALMVMVDQRVEKLKRGELGVADFTLKGAVDCLVQLRDRGVTLYLASGTDDAYVKSEATALRYANLFNGGIYGATDVVGQDVKRAVIEKICSTHHLAGAELICFGDGPVEVREGKRRGGVAVGIASDEVRRYGICHEKRTRLICAGADVIIPDFSQRKHLLDYLFGA